RHPNVRDHVPAGGCGRAATRERELGSQGQTLTSAGSGGYGIKRARTATGVDRKGEKERRNKIAVAPLVGALLSLGIVGQAGAAETVKVGICVSWPNYSFYEVVKQKHLLPDYDIEQTIFEDPVGGHSALAAGQVDVYYCTGDYTPIAVASGTDTVNVAFTSPSYGVHQIILVPGVTPETLQGKNVA